MDNSHSKLARGTPMKSIKTISILAGSLTTILVAVAGLTSVLKLAIPSLISGFLLALSFTLLMVCVHYFHRRNMHLYSMLGIIFAVMYGLLICLNYYLQLNMASQMIPKIDLLAMDNPNSIMGVIEMLGYFFMGLSTLAVIPIFGRSLLEKLIKTIFLINGILGIGGLIAYTVGLDLNIALIGLAVWNIIMPIGAGLLTYYFISRNPADA
jgi:hypothetical protein